MLLVQIHSNLFYTTIHYKSVFIAFTFQEWSQNIFTSYNFFVNHNRQNIVPFSTYMMFFPCKLSQCRPCNLLYIRIVCSKQKGRSLDQMVNNDHSLCKQNQCFSFSFPPILLIPDNNREDELPSHLI